MAAAVLVVVALGSPAWAHARLISSDPPGGATITEAPTQVTLTFSERIETSFGGVQVFDPSGQRMEAGDAQITDTQVQVPLRPLETAGTYTVAFRIVSGDSHPVESRFAFTYQPPPPPSPAATQAVPPPGEATSPPAATVPADIELEDAGPGTAAGLWIARLINYLAITAVVGLLLAAAVLLVTAGPGLSALQHRTMRLGAVGAALWALSGVALFVFGLSTAAARPLPAALGGELPARFASTRFGYTVLAQAALALAVAVVAASARNRRAALAITGIGGFGPAWWGHAGTAKLSLIALTSDWAHVLAVTAWVGGLAALAALLLRPAAVDTGLATPTGRFSRMAGWALGIVLVTGTVNALLRVGAPEQLVTTAWGRLVLLKLALFTGIAALGWRNRNRLLPRLSADQADQDGARTAFRTMALAEVGLMVVTIGAATGLASSIPADAEVAARIQSVATAFGDGQINLTIDPAVAGDNAIHIYFLDATGQPREVADPVLTLTSPQAQIEPTMFVAGPGHYTALSQPIPEPGDYQVAITARVDEQPVTATGNVIIR